MRFSRAAMLSLCALASLAVNAFGQVSLGTLRGTVTDSSAAVVPNASIVVKEPATGVEVRRLTTDTQGNYEVADIKPGTYTLTCEAAGFKLATVDQILMEMGQIRRVDVTLTVGAPTQEVVTVIAGAALIDTESGTISGKYSNKTHQDVPLVDTYPSPSSTLTTLPGIQGGSGSFGGLRASGQGTAQIAEGFDGINNDSSQANNSEFFEEVGATTVNAPADSERIANVDLVTKRGQNAIHGMAYYKVFSSGLMARNFFAARRTPYLEHEWEIEAGGPIIRNRMFMFGTWFSERIPLGSFDTATVPTADMRNGVFTSVIKDPLTGQAFANNTIPQSRMSSVALKFQQGYYPLPTVAGLTNNYPFEFRFNSDLYKYDGLLFRLDHNFTAKNSFTARWLLRSSPYVLENGLPSLVWTRDRNHQQWVAGDTHVFSPSLVNTIRLGYSRDFLEDGKTTAGVTPPDGSKVLTETGLQGSNPGGLTGQGFPSISITGFTTLANVAGGINTDNHAYTIDESITKAFGRHVWKSGAMYQLQDQFSGALPNYGSFTFDGSLSGNAYADFLLGAPRSSSRINPLINRRQHAGDLGMYTEDTFKVNKKITLQYGLRWDYYPSPTYDDGLMYNFDLNTGNVLVPANTISKVSPLFPKTIPVTTGNPVTRSDTRNFRPRVSFAYRMTSSLVLRGGYGSFSERLSLFQRVNGAGPFQISETYQNNAGQVPQFLFPNPYPTDLTLATVPSQSVTSLPGQTDNGTIHQFNVTIEKEIARTGLRASYVGTRGRGLNYSLNVNIPPPSLVPFTTARRPYAQLVTVTSYRADGASHYDSLELETKRRAGSLTFDVNYSYQTNQNNFSDLENPYDVLSHWSNDQYTRRHYAVGTVIWTIPVGFGPAVALSCAEASGTGVRKLAVVLDQLPGDGHVLFPLILRIEPIQHRRERGIAGPGGRPGQCAGRADL